MLNEALRLIRVFHDLKQGDLATKLDVSKSYLSEIENGIKKPTLDLIERYSREFHIPLSSILFFAEELPNVKGGEKVRMKIAAKVLDFLRLVERNSSVSSI